MMPSAWAVPVLFLVSIFATSCTSKQVEASGYSDQELGGPVSIRVPAQFSRLKATPPQALSGFIGDAAGQPDDLNFWAISYAFGFRESTDASGAAHLPALLLVSRVADSQSFASAQLFYEGATRFSKDKRWSNPQRLEWKSRQISKSMTLFQADLIPGKQGAFVQVMVDRESLVQALLLGERQALQEEVAQRVLSDMRTELRVKEPLEDYFHKIGKDVQSSSDQRRKNYLALLETLQREELDYTPTPRVVVFNANLAGQFWWPLFDRSGVPSYFAIAGRLGQIQKNSQEEWKRLEDLFPGMRIIAAVPAANSWNWQGLASTQALPERATRLLQDTNWLVLNDTAPAQVFAVLEFPFSTQVPDLSQWLNALEAVGKHAERNGLVAMLR
jgi:hypothetical protein